MNICVAGWYFRPQFMRDLSLSGYDCFVVKHRDGDTQGLPSAMYENRGLEFGAYRQYVENRWDGESDVLFIHDDAEFSDLVALTEIKSLRGMGVEQAYIFHDEINEYMNGGAHGRGIWIRGDILRQLASEFPADMNNGGVNVGVIAQRGILMFHERIMKCGQNTGVIAIIPGLEFAHRGRLHQHMFVYRKTKNAVPGGIVSIHE